MLHRIEQQTEYNTATNTKQKATQTLSFLMCASCLFVNHVLVLLFLFLCAVCTAKPHFAAPVQPAAPGAESEPPSGCYATAWTNKDKCFV